MSHDNIANVLLDNVSTPIIYINAFPPYSFFVSGYFFTLVVSILYFRLTSLELHFIP